MPAPTEERSPVDRSPFHAWARLWSAFFVLALGLVVTLVVQAKLRESAREQDERRFNGEVRRTYETLAARVNHYLVAVQHLQGLFHASGGVDRDGWNRWLPSMNWRWQYPNMLELGYAETVAGSNVARVRYSATLDGQPSRYPEGSNVGSSLDHRRAMELAGEQGQTVSGGVHETVSANGEKALAHLIFYPVYEGGVEPKRSERAGKARGFVYGLFRADDLYRETVGAETNLLVRLRVADVTGDSFDRLNALTNSVNRTVLADGQYRREELDTALGRLWLFEFSSLPAFHLGSRSNLATIALVTGTALSLTFFSVVWVQMRGRHRAEALTSEIQLLNTDLEARVATRTRELEVAKEDLAKALVGERELGELKDRFVAMVSHEFRTPLGIIMSAVELLRSYFDRLDPAKRAELLSDIQNSTRQMASMMEQVLLLGRVNAGKQTFHGRPLDLAALMSRFTEEVGTATGQPGRIQLAMATEDLQGARSDDTILRHVLVNLLSNACKYSPPEQPVDFSVRRVGDDAELVIRDRGIGIPEADQRRLFEAFHRASNVGSVEGTGLGLLIVKRCVELHRGTIRFQSEPGQGTTVTVVLPMFEG